ncbi:MAG: TonB-dependent receptor, partial [Sphingomonas sp.]|nr:TonB-dependent receptor [Sphingomonas sp.]
EDGTYLNSTAFALFFLDPIYPQYQPQNDGIIANLPSAVHYRTHYRQFSQELRLSSNNSSPGPHWLSWVAGAYFATQSVHNTDYQTIDAINSTFQSIYGTSLEQSLVETAYGNPTYGQPGGGPAITLFPNGIDESDDRTYRQQQYAVFGQASIAFAFTQNATSKAFLPKATLYHELSRQSSVYASAAKGFRLGGPTGPITFGPTSVCNGDFQNIGQTTQPTHFTSDSLWTYEVGTKNEFLGGRARFNASGYLTNWRNIQQQIYLPTCGYYFTSNIGNARIWGAEADGSFKLSPSLLISGTVSVNDAKVIQSNNPIDVAVGQHLIAVPGFTATAGANYLHRLNSSIAITGLVNYAYVGHSYGSYLLTDPNYHNPGYAVVNASVGIRFGPNALTLYAKNLLNNQTIIQRPQINTVVEGYTVHPRTIGLSLRLVE